MNCAATSPRPGRRALLDWAEPLRLRELVRAARRVYAELLREAERERATQ